MVLLLESCAPAPEKVPKNSYGLQVIKHAATYRKLIEKDSIRRMVLLANFLHPLHYKLYYASTDNFTHQQLYHHPALYLRLEAATKLARVQDSLLKTGLCLFLFDAYRPYSVTQKMWQMVPDERYAANPARGSGHNRGVAIDLTLADAATGLPLEMPTPFDNFSDSAHHNFMVLAPAILKNRALLKGIMAYFGFEALPTEWWHYSIANPKKYQLLDLNFIQMKKNTQ